MTRSRTATILLSALSISVLMLASGMPGLARLFAPVQGFFLLFGAFTMPVGLLVVLAPLLLPLERWSSTIFGGRRHWVGGKSALLDIPLMLVYPLVYLSGASGTKSYGCCDNDAAMFASDHIAVLQFVFIASALGFLALVHTRKALPPFLEFLCLGTQALGIGFAIAIVRHDLDLASFGILPWILNILWGLWWRSKLLRETLEERGTRFGWLLDVLRSGTMLGRLGQLLLLLTGGVVVLALIGGVLLLFGQPADAFVRVFTQTYTHHFSELHPDCSNVNCTGMYLCTIGDRGHERIVGPTRPGWRQGQPIRCSRQLLVSNAFEDSLARHIPFAQRWGRHWYDHLGTHLDPNRFLFRHRLACDAVHLAMKPAEWCFLLWLYLVEPQPELVIAAQYRK